MSDDHGKREEEFRLNVVDELRKLGLTAYNEYPGVVSVFSPDGRLNAWTGMHGYDYASWMDVRDDGNYPIENNERTSLLEDAENDSGVCEIEHDTSLPRDCSGSVARAWWRCVTMAQERRIADIPESET
jgi:hypothetical protein